MPEAIIKYSKLIEDDGGFEKIEKDLEETGKRLEKSAEKIRKSFKLVSPKDTEAVRRLEKEVETLQRGYKAVDTQKEKLSKTRKKATELTKKEIVQLEAERKAMADSRKEAKLVSRIKEAQAGSIEELRVRLAFVTKAWASLSKEERENSVRGERLIQSKKKLTDELKKEERATGDTRREVGNYTDSVKKAIIELRKEDLELKENVSILKKQQSELQKGSLEWRQYQKEIETAENRLKDINGEIKESNGGGLSGLAGNIQGGGGLGGLLGNLTSKLGPAGVAIGSVVAGIGKIGLEIAQVTARFDEFRSSAGKIGFVGQELEDIVANTIALENTFQNEDGNELLNAQNTLIKEFGLNAQDSFELVESGLLSAGNSQGDLTDNIREYASQVRGAGGSAIDLLSILDKSGEEGIFSDKGIDVVKEFGLRIREQSDATKTSLEKAFGKKFTKDLFKNLNDGSITSIDALRSVSKELNNVDLSAKETQEVVANVFGGPGEDAGLRYLKSLEDIGGSQKDLIDLSDPLVRAQKDLSAANQELAVEQGKLTKNFSGLGTQFKIFGAQVAKTGVQIINSTARNIKQAGRGLSNLFSFNSAQQTTAGFKQTLDSLVPSFGGLTDAWFELTEGERAAVAEAEAYNSVSEIASDIINDEIFDINNKVTALDDENLSQEERDELLQNLLDKYPEYTSFLVDENGNLKDLTKSRKELNKAIIESAVARAKEAAFQETVNELVQSQIDKVKAQQEDANFDGNIFSDFGKTFDLAINGTAVSQADADIQDLQDSMKALSNIDLGDITNDLSGIFEDIDLDSGTDAYKENIDSLKDSSKTLETELNAINERLSGDITNDQKKALENQRKNLQGEAQAVRRSLEQLGVDYRSFLGLGGEEGSTNDNFSGGSTGGGADKALERRAEKEFDLQDEIRKRRAELLEDDLERELENLDIKIDKDKERFDALNKEQEKFLSAGLIDEVEFKKRTDQITTISELAESEREKRKKEIRDKFSEAEKKQKLKDLSELQKLEENELKRNLNSEGASGSRIAFEVQQLTINQIQEEIKLRKTLGSVSVDERQKLINAELKLIEISRKVAETQEDQIRALEGSQVQGSIDGVDRLIKDQENIISEAGDKVSKVQLNQLKALNQERFELQKRQLEDEFDFLISRTEEGSIERQKIEQDKNNALLNLNDQYADKVKGIDDRILQNTKQSWENITKAIEDALEGILDKVEENAQKEIELREKGVSTQEKEVDEQRQRAKDGLTNTLAFEKKELLKRQNELIESQKELERIQKIKSLYSSYQNYSGQGDKNAVGKALRDLAILESIAASFGDGGITGVDGYGKVRTDHNGITKGRSHNMKGGVLAYHERGEGFFSKREVQNMGADNFYKLKSLAGKGMLTENLVPQQKMNFINSVPKQNDNSELSKELKSMGRKLSAMEIQKIDIKKLIDGTFEVVETMLSENRTRKTTFKVGKKRF